MVGGGNRSGPVPKSPFFRPSEPPPPFTSTPGGTKHRRKLKPGEQEHKSTILGCSANLINAIVGSGIVGLPYAMEQAGLVAGIILVLLCAVLTEKSLRLLIETAKHAHVPTYEMASEAAFGRVGFIFVAANMFLMAYGAMLSYLMIVKDVYSTVLHVGMDNAPMKRAILFIVSVCIILPVSCQRDMADLAKTSVLNVTFNFTMIFLLVFVCAPVQESWETFDVNKSIIHYDTIFVGLGVLSFAFVCQHSGFIIAGSLDQPTKDRWGKCTKIALAVACFLSLLCGLSGYIAYGDATTGNILNNLDNSVPSMIARGLLGTTMLFVYPMESFVARHVCVVMFFEGRQAHEGDDTSVLNRKDRRIALTVFLYLSAVIPAAILNNLGTVLASTGCVGGSCLAYIGPGAIYLGIHGGRFLELSRAFFGRPVPTAMRTESTMDIPPDNEEEVAPLYVKNPQPPSSSSSTTPAPSSSSETEEDSLLVRIGKTLLWYLWFMPIWCWIASIGKTFLTGHVYDLAMKSPHPIRIGNVRFASTKVRSGATRVIMLSERSSKDLEEYRQQQIQHLHPKRGGNEFPTNTMLIHSDSLPEGYDTTRTAEGRIVALPPTPTLSKFAPPPKASQSKTTTTNQDYGSINNTIGANLLAKRKEEEAALALEDDPQEIPPSVMDFAIAIFYIIFGVVAMVAGMISIYSAS